MCVSSVCPAGPLCSLSGTSERSSLSVADTHKVQRVTAMKEVLVLIRVWAMTAELAYDDVHSGAL